MTTPPEDIDAMFDLPPLPDLPQPATSTLEAEEAALAAELSAVIASGGVAGDAPDSRTNLRVKVSWPARMHLPDGHVVELKVRDISEGGVGLKSDRPIPAYTVVNFEMVVPPLDDSGPITPVKGTIRTTYAVAQGAEILCGSSWQVPPVGMELVSLWIRRLRL